MKRVILRWEVKVGLTEQQIGGGPVRMVDARSMRVAMDTIEVWTEETVPSDWTGEHRFRMRDVEVFGTGESIPEEVGAHLGSTVDCHGINVWHLYETF